MEQATKQAFANSLAGLAQLVPFSSANANDTGRWCCEQLELGNIVYFPAAPFEFPSEWQAFLVQQQKQEARYHKNVAYRPAEDRLTGFDGDQQTKQHVQSILRGYSERVAQFLSTLLSAYQRNWKKDYASFRPFEEEGRDLRTRARNDLLHTDAFPTRPTHGDRILRFFTNISPQQPRVWITGQTFESLAEQYAVNLGIQNSKQQHSGWVARAAQQLAKALHLPVTQRSPYDDFMLRFHHYLKENAEFQKSTPRTRHEFPPGSCWMVFTDMVSHAVLSGRFALEQTLIVSRNAMVTPEKSPVRILERLSGHSMVS